MAHICIGSNPYPFSLPIFLDETNTERTAVQVLGHHQEIPSRMQSAQLQQLPAPSAAGGEEGDKAGLLEKDESVTFFTIFILSYIVL